MTTTYYQ